MAGRKTLLCGHKVALFYEGEHDYSDKNSEHGRMGYVQATWSTGQQSSAPVGLLRLDGRDATPPSFEDCIFQIVAGDNESTLVKSKAREEVKFGQVIRLIHINQGKALCCSKKKSGAADKSSKRVTLEPLSNCGVKKGWTSKWRIAPRYQVRGEGEKVCEGDQITLQPVLSCGAHFLSVAELPIVGSDFLEVNGAPKDARDTSGAPRELGLTIRAYDTDDLDTDALRGGDCIMLYHKEQRGYLVGAALTEEEESAKAKAGGGAAGGTQSSLGLSQRGGDVFLLPDSDSFGIESKDPSTYLSNGMFIVEWEDPLQGGVMQAASWNPKQVLDAQRFRLRLLGNATDSFYLSLRQLSSDEKAEKARAEGLEAYGSSGALKRHTSDLASEMSKKVSFGAHGADVAAHHRRKKGDSLTTPGWKATLCHGSDAADDLGTLFQFLQTGDNQEAELEDTSRVILWANAACIASKGQEPTSMFLHVGGEKATSSHSRQLLGNILQVGCSRRALQKDGFELRKVPAGAFLSLNSVLSQIPPIRKYTKDLQRLAQLGESTQKSPDTWTEDRETLQALIDINKDLEPDRLISSLEEMVSRCFVQTQGNMQDALDIDCTADRSQQLLLVDQNAPVTCLALLRAQANLPFEPQVLFGSQAHFLYQQQQRGSVQPPSLQPPKSSLRITNLCYKLIRSSVKSAPDLAARVSASLGDEGLLFMLEQGTFRHDLVGAVPCLIELFRDNKVLQASTPIEFLERVCAQILENKWRCEYLKLLPYLISSEGDVVERLQQRTADLLLKADDPPLLKMKVDTTNKSLMIRAPFNHCDPDEENETPSWIGIETFCDVSEDVKNKVLGRKTVSSRRSVSTSSVAMRMDDLYEYFRLQVILFSRFCIGKGQGPKDRAALTKAYIPEDCIFEAIFGGYQDIIPAGMQCAFIHLACTALLDDYINIHHNTLHVVKVWDNYNEPCITLTCSPSAKILKQRCLEHLQSNTSHSLRYPQTIEKTLGFMKMLFLFLRSGFILKEEIPVVASLLTQILDGTTDEYLPLGGNELPGGHGYVQHRKEFTEESKILLQLREKVIVNLSMLLDFSASYDVEKTLDAIKAYIDEGGPAEEDTVVKFPFFSQLQSFDPEVDKIDEMAEENYVPPATDENFLMQGFGMMTGIAGEGLGAVADFGGMLGDMFLGDDDKRLTSTNLLVEVLLDVAQYRYLPLRESATKLLFRLTNRGPHIAQVCREVQVLGSSASVKFYRDSKYLMEELRDFAADCYDEAGVTEVIRLCHKMKQMCYTNGAIEEEQQSILVQLDVHHTLLGLPYCQDVVDTDVIDIVQELLGTVFDLLLVLTTNHPDNKAALLDEFLDPIVNCMEYKCGAFELIQQLYADNPKYCLVAPDNVLRAVLTTPLEAPCVNLLLHIMRPADRNLYRKQQAVYNHMTDLLPNELNFLSTSDKTSWTSTRKKLRMVEDLLYKQDYLNVSGRIGQHLVLVNLLRAVAQGKELSLKQEIRQDIWTDRYADPVEHLLNTCQLKQLPFWYRSIYLQFFREVVVDDRSQLTSICSQKMSDGTLTIASLLAICTRDVLAWPGSGGGGGGDVGMPEAAGSHRVSTSSSAAGEKPEDNAEQVERLGVKFQVENEPRAEELAGVHFKSSAMYTEYVFGAILPMAKHFMIEFMRCEELHKELDVYTSVVKELGDLVRAFIRLVDLQRSELHSADVPGSMSHDALEVLPVNYVQLFLHAGNPDTLHTPHPAAATQRSRLLSVRLRGKLASFLAVAETHKDELGSFFPPGQAENLARDLQAGGPKKDREASVVVDAADWRKAWKQSLVQMSVHMPALRPDAQFKSLAIILMRKGEMGKAFIKNTVIGAEAEGLLFCKDDEALQLDALQLVETLCVEFTEEELAEGKGGDDANILLPQPCFYLDTVEEEEKDAEEDRVVLHPALSMEDKQNALSSFGMAEKIVNLVESPQTLAAGLSPTTHAALTTGIALLKGGNREVQDSIEFFFKEISDEEFFVHVRSQLRLFSEALKDITRTLKKEVCTKKIQKKEDTAKRGGVLGVIGGVGAGMLNVGAGMMKGLGNIASIGKGKGGDAKRGGARARGQTEEEEEELQGLTSGKSLVLEDDEEALYTPLNPKLEAIPDEYIEEMKARFYVSHMNTVIRFLQLMTEGHHLGMQNYLREQGDNHTSIDIVEAVATFLQQFKYLNRITSSVMQLTIACLVEFCQGPCSGNQTLLVSQNMGEMICRILNDVPGRPMVFKADMELCGDPEVLEELWGIKETAVDLLVALVEGGVPHATSKTLVSNVTLEILAHNMVRSHELAGLSKGSNVFGDALDAGMDVMSDLLKPKGSGSELDDKLNLGCGIFIFFKVMLDAQTLRERAMCNKEPVIWCDKEGRTIKQVLRREENECYTFFNRTVATIEIARGDAVERVYFRVLEKSRANLPEKSKDRVKNEVQRDSGDGARVSDFFDKSIGLIHEIGYYEEMRNTRGLALIHKFSVPLEWASLFLSFAINIYLLSMAHFSYDDTVSRLALGDENNALDYMGRTVIAFQCLQMVHFGMGPTRIYLDFKWREWEQGQEDDVMRECKANLSIAPVDRTKLGKDKLLPTHYIAQSLYMLSRFWPFWLRGLYLVSSFLGYYLSPFWYCAQPLQVIEFSPKLMNVVLAVTTNGKSLLLTLGLMMIVIYMFASWAFFRFSGYFDEEGDFGTGFNCDTLFRCWVLLTVYGLRQGGGIADILMKPNWSDMLVFERLIFDVLYFLVLIILFLNIVFGIIIDTFAELRERREFIEDDQQSKCFICGMERSIFDREAGAQGGFEHHYQGEHNMWTYLLFLHYIFEKDTDNLTGQEKYVKDMVDEKDPGFFPIGKSMILSHREDEPGSDSEDDSKKNLDRPYIDRLQAALQQKLAATEEKLITTIMNPLKTPTVMSPPLQTMKSASPPPAVLLPVSTDETSKLEV